MEKQEIEKKLNRMRELEPAVKEHKELNEEVKGLFDTAGVEVVGDYLIKITIGKTFRIDTKSIPADIAEKYKKEIETKRVNIKYLKEEKNV